MHKLRLSASRVVFAVVIAVVLGACRAEVTVDVDVGEDGSGVVTVSVTLDQEAIARAGDLSTLFSTEDLVNAGWEISGPMFEPKDADASTAVSASWSASKKFSSPDEFAEVMSELGVVSQVSMQADPGWFSSSTDVGIVVDLSGGLSAFGDSQLAAATGSQIGVDPAAFTASTGIDLTTATSFELVVHVPGSVEATNASEKDGSTLSWPLPLGSVTDARVSSADTHFGAYLKVLLGVVLVVVAVLSWRVASSRRSTFGRHSNKHWRKL